MLLLRWYLARQNKLRDAKKNRVGRRGSQSPAEDQEKVERGEVVDETYEDAEVYLRDAQGVEVGKVDKAFLDLTDIENRSFRYVL